MGAVMVPAGDIILLHGGYRSNYQYESLWLFDTNLGTWREKMDFVHALYPKNCKYLSFLLSQYESGYLLYVTDFY